jgi:flavin-dependent dehydrogenase
MTAAVVLGGGFAGVLAATVLARHVDEVTVVESGRHPAGPAPRSGVPQGHHSHLLVTGGAQALETLLPGSIAALLHNGAHLRGLPGDALILSADGWFRRHDTGAYLISCSRWLMDHVVRQRAWADAAVSVRERTHVLGLVGTASRVTGVAVRGEDARTRTIRADLVVDATGRRSRATAWLSAIGGPAVEETVVDPGLAYATRVYRAPVDLADKVPAVMIHPRPAAGGPGHGATLFPIEDGRWIVTLTGTRGAEPPTDEQGFTECAYALPSPVVAELVAAAKPLGGVRPYRRTANRRRYFERVPRPDGFLVLGDALVAVNPVHSHGMSVAALSVLRMASELEWRGPEPRVLADLQAAVAEEAQRSWRMAVAQDAEAAGGPTPRAVSAAERRHRARLTRAVVASGPLMTEFFRAQTLVTAPRPVAASLALESARADEPALTSDQAIAQYPGLADWWSAGARRAPERSEPHPGRQP